jgi:L-ascorbate metabolism protein UlaG (beta-lactamase superfamily)
MISHNHYDHLDRDTVLAISAAQPDVIWVVPLGMKEWMTAESVENVIEFDWSESVTLMPEDVAVSGSKALLPLTIKCT